MGPLKWVFQFGLFALVVCVSPAGSPASPQSSNPSQTSHAPQTYDPEDILRNFTSYSIKSDTVYLHRETLLNELQKRGEFSAWGLTATEDSKAADVVIMITLPFLTWEWNYKMVQQPTGTVLGTGKVSAAVEKTAAPQLAAMIVKRIQEARPLPASFLEAQTTRPNASSETEKSWRVKYLGPASILPKDTPVMLTVSSERVTVRDTKNFSLSIPAVNVRAADSRKEVRKATKGWEDFWGRTTGETSLILFVAPIVLAGEGILAPIKTTDRYLSLYWIENGSMRGMEFHINAGDAKSLLAELSRATGRDTQDVQEQATRTQKLIKEQYAHSPVVQIDKPVTLGWDMVTNKILPSAVTLAPGNYHLVVSPRQGHYAEVFFLPMHFSARAFESVTPDALAQFESRKTPLESKSAPTVSYREQNGILTFNQIETGEFILRFTPIPLGFAN